MADEPILAYNNLLASMRVVPELGASVSASFPAENLYKWDMKEPAVFIPLASSMQFLIGGDYAAADAPDTLILGSMRHVTAGFRSDMTAVSLYYNSGAGSMSNLINAEAVAAVNKASLHRFTAPTVVADSAFSSGSVPASIKIYSVRFLAGYFYICGINSAGTAGVIYRADGMMGNVSSATITTANVITDIAFDGVNTIVAIDSAGNSYVSSDYGATFGSANTIAATTMGQIIYGRGEQFVAVPASSGTAIYTSADGVTWAAQALASAEASKLIGYQWPVYIVTGSNGTIQTSTDAITWTTQATGKGTVKGIAVSGSRWMIVNSAGSFDSSIDDGTTWQGMSATGATALNGLAVYHGGFVAIGTYGGSPSAIRTTDDGDTWTNESVSQSGGIASNLLMDIAFPDTATATSTPQIRVVTRVLRITITGLTAGNPVTIPELYVGPSMQMPFLDYGYDPYVEVFKGKTQDHESGRQTVTLHYKRVELKPRWSIVGNSYVAAIEDFREEQLENRLPMWWAWQPDTSPTECYMMRHKGESAPFPIKAAGYRSFALDLIEAL